MKSAYWNSTTGRRPSCAAPTAIPTVASSAMGASSTRSGPNRSMNPSVTLKAPPYAPMSCPSMKTRSSRSISSHRASAMAVRYVASPRSARFRRGPIPASPSGMAPALAGGRVRLPVPVLRPQPLRHVVRGRQRGALGEFVTLVELLPDPSLEILDPTLVDHAKVEEELLEPL